MVTECTSVPLVPLTVIVDVPAFVCFRVVSVSTDVPDCVTDGGLKLAVTNFGRAPVDSATVLLNPDRSPIVTV
jgi:hypothetical protein